MRCNVRETLTPTGLGIAGKSSISDRTIPNYSEKSMRAVVAIFSPLSKWPPTPLQITPQSHP